MSAVISFARRRCVENCDLGPGCYSFLLVTLSVQLSYDAGGQGVGHCSAASEPSVLTMEKASRVIAASCRQ